MFSNVSAVGRAAESQGCVVPADLQCLLRHAGPAALTPGVPRRQSPVPGVWEVPESSVHGRPPEEA